MILVLRCLFIGILLCMIGVTSWASMEVALWNTPRAVATHPWFIATLFDTYFAFLAFWLWLAWVEQTWVRRIGWLIAILLLGNIAMAIYMLIRLFRLPRTATMDDVIARRQPTITLPLQTETGSAEENQRRQQKENLGSHRLR